MAAAVQIQQDVNLQHMNTLRLPAQARYFSRFSSLSDLLFLHEAAVQYGVSMKVLGGGSNVLMAPQIKALVIHSASEKITQVSRDADYVIVDVDAGMNWHDWVCASVKYGHGLENLSLIPGTVGAAPVQNIGAYGVEAGEFILSVTGYQLSTRQLRTFSADECRFGYRDSIFKRELKDDFVILRVRFALADTFRPVLSYAPLNQLNAFDLTPQKLITEVVQVRRSKLPDPAEIANAGSFFQNPLVSLSQAAALKARYPDMPQYPQASGVKLAAGWLIQECGFKGKAIGPVAMYEKQALVLTAQDGATLADVKQLQTKVQQAVADTFSVWLHPEPGDFS